MSTTTPWFAVDRDGLRKLIEDRPRSSAIFELIQNAWDEASTSVDVTLAAIDGVRGRARLIVVDDNPTGFADLSHAYTMFAESGKKGDAEKRGRFNLGEKLVLALCDEAEIVTTTGHVIFRRDGKREPGKERTERGSRFQATIRMTKPELAEVIASIETLIPPANVETTFNGRPILRRNPIASFTTTLATVIADAESVLRRTSRKTEVRVYEPLAGEKPMIYELGIPVVELDGDRYHVDIQQKVPLTIERDNVPPAYLRTLRAAVLNETFDRLEEPEAKQVWVDHAISAPEITPEAVRGVIEARFGDKVATYDPTDLEANKRAADEGYKIVHGGTFSRDAWANIRSAGAITSAGRMFPTGRGIGAGTPDGSTPAGEVKVIPEAEWTEAMRAVMELTRDVGSAVLGTRVTAEIVLGPFGDHTAADFNSGLHRLRFNLRTLGRSWFERENAAKIFDLLVHEFAHNAVGDHFSQDYYRETTRIAGAMVALALREPTIFGPFARHLVAAA